MSGSDNNYWRMLPWQRRVVIVFVDGWRHPFSYFLVAKQQPFCDYPYATGPSTLSSLPPPLHPPPPPPPPNVPPPPVPQENDKNSIRQTTSLPISLAASSLTNHVVGAYHGIQQLARKISRKKRKTGGHKVSPWNPTTATQFSCF